MPNDEARFDGSITTAWAQSPNRSVAVGSGWLRLVDNLIDVASVAAALLPSADGQGASRRAGHTSAVGSNSRPRSVHPRPRGEHPLAPVPSPLLYGSSPPARGTLPKWLKHQKIDRFIPARAGNTPCRAITRCYRAVHRRAVTWVTGICVENKAYGQLRFIPARTGNTAARSCRCRTRSVHPRPRGEHDHCEDVRHFGHGSSPPARGTHHGQTPVHAAGRFIPARAGNTQFDTVCHDNLPVHPRPRGEHCLIGDCHCVSPGSSPPARGTR